MVAGPTVGLSKTSILWAAAETGGTTALSMATMLVMARMIGPDEFGIAALIIGGVLFLNLFVEGLFHDALIQNPDTDDLLFETALSLVMIISLGIVAIGTLAAVAANGAPWAATAWLFVGASCSLPFSGALGIGNARMRRDLVFREVARASLIGRLAGSIFGVGLAIGGFGAWSFVGQYTSIVILQAVLLYSASHWRPRLRRSFKALWPTCRFALPYACMHSLVALRLQGFLMLVAAQMGLTAAGFVNAAFRLTTTPQVLLTTAFTNLGLPLLARQQGSGPDMERSFLLLTQMVMSTTIPAFVGLALSANDLVPLLLGPDWTTAIPLVQVVALGSAVSFLRLPASSVLRALGYVRYSFASSSFQLGFTIILMILMQVHSLWTAVLLWVFPALVQLPMTVLALLRVSTIGWQTLCRSLAPGLLATAAMSAVVVAVGAAMQADPAVLRLAAKIACGATTSIAVLLIADGRSRTAISAVLRRASA